MSASKEIIYLKGYLRGKNYLQAIKALILAERLHEGQTRRSGEPYIIHPVRVANGLISLGIADENMIIAALLHDVLEDTSMTSKMLVNEQKLPKDAVEIIVLLTKEKDYKADAYYNNIAGSSKAAIVKIADRCHNIATLQFFDDQKIGKYVADTEKYIYPLFNKIKDTDPSFEDSIYYMKYHIDSIIGVVRALRRDIFEVKDNEK
ncbi:HD domain-containing protein [uncultured Clostridium sp.]|jgi:GTP pyrophosphokinase|uniref:HD domain-containing protein n=1 Tax=uncultured Clostridium sp. TaxID=59620 RepID=UPI00260CE06B|nr:HD domain-containing protein [uncultured Clostridium sp.]